MASSTLLSISEHAAWLSILQEIGQYDFYHLPGYHAMAESRRDGTAHLYVYRDAQHLIALPFLLRRIDSVPGLVCVGKLFDATSVYGYAGPIASSLAIPADVVSDFQVQLGITLKDIGVISAFSRLHPLLDQCSLLRGMGEQLPIGMTVSIDLTLPPDEQRAAYRKGHRYDINKLLRLGLECKLDYDCDYLADFVLIYHETMARVSATEGYFFDESYFRQLLMASEINAKLFVCLKDSVLVAGGIFTLCKGIVQYHLSGTRSAYLSHAPTKLLIDAVRQWANQEEASVLHLGGGVGSQEDNLFQFKAGFSKRRHEFAVWRWIVQPDLYARVTDAKAWWNVQNGVQSTEPAYFPAYRSPVVPHTFTSDI